MTNLMPAPIRSVWAFLWSSMKSLHHLYSTRPRSTTTEALGISNLVELSATTSDFTGGPSGLA